MLRSLTRSVVAAVAFFSAASVQAELPLELLKSLPVNLAPGSPVVQGLDGNFYGICTPSDLAGDSGGGLVYTLTPAGAFKVIHFFPHVSTTSEVNAGGSFPTGRLFPCEDGSLIGITQSGGAYGHGIIYRLFPSGEFSVLFDFPPEVVNAPRQLFRASNGDFWGHTDQVVFRWTLEGTFTIYHRFPLSSPGDDLDPSTPVPAYFEPSQLTSIAEGPDGKIYGLTAGGGPVTQGTAYRYYRGQLFPYEANFDYGTFFRIDGVEQITIVKEFDAQVHGAWSLTLGPDGNFYSTSNGYLYTAPLVRKNLGFVLKLTPAGEASFLHEFLASAEGEYPAALTVGSDGLLYGECGYGGAQGAGSIFSLTTGGTYTTLLDFAAGEGARSGLTEAADGSLYEVIQRTENVAPEPELEAQGLRALRAPRPKPRAARVVRIAVRDEPTNRPPMARGEVLTARQFTRERGTGQWVASFAPLANDRDADGNPLSLTATTPAQHGSVSFDPATKKITYRPSGPRPENDAFTYTVSDDQGGSTTATVRVETSPNGVYAAPLLDGSAEIGKLKVRVVGSRTVTGTVVVDGKARRLAGRFDAGQRFRKSFRARDGRLFTVELKLVPAAGEEWEIAATVRDDATTYTATLQ